MPHVTRMRAIHHRAPNFASARFDGTSSSTYGTKNTLAAMPNAAGSIFRSAFIVSAATPRLARSMIARK